MLTGVALLTATPTATALSPFTTPQATTQNNPAFVTISQDSFTQGAEKFIQKLADQGIGFLSNPALSDKQKRAEFKKLLTRRFDLKTIGRFALGRNWRTATKAQQQEYQRLFQKMVVDVYASRFSDYSGQDLEIRKSRKDSEKDVTVTSFIVPNSGGSEIQVDWRVRYKNGAYRVIDISIEGVSMAVTQRSDFSSVIQRGGGKVEVLLEHLRNI